VSEFTDFSTLVGDIYDAALDPSLWSSVLEKICGYVPGLYANIFIQDANNRFANSIFKWGINPTYYHSYLEIYAKLNPVFPAAFFAEVGEVFSAYDFIPPEQAARTRFYKEWATPQGIGDNVGAILEKSATSCAVIAIPQPRSEARAGVEVRDRMRLIVPHVRRAVLIGKAFDLQKAVAANFAATVDALRTALFLMDDESRVVHANPAGMAMLAADDVLYRPTSRLRAYDPAADKILNELFTACATGDDLAIGPRGAAIHLSSRSGADYVAHVLPLTSGARRQAASPHRAVAILVVQNAAQNPFSPPEVVAKAFGLTPREVTVLFALVETPGVAEVAELLGLSKTTIRAHLRQLFAKTGTTRQAELVRLVAKFASPVA
jgi:DNA-binding CsgD family transcriptional regulator/PAS domain-containing protein